MNLNNFPSRIGIYRFERKFSKYLENYIKPSVVHRNTRRCILYVKKLLGVIIDDKLTFNEHVSKLCKKASNKLHALARISKYMTKDKLRTIMNAFFTSQFAYCPLIWMFHNRTLKNRINKLQERALRLVHNDNTSSFYELLQKDNSFIIHH